MTTATTEKPKQELKVQIGCRCKVCGYRIRGANHKNGSHHKSKEPK